MEITSIRIDREEINLRFIKDSNEDKDDISTLITSLDKIKKFINEPGFANKFSKEEKELWNNIFNILLFEPAVEGIQCAGGDRIYVED